MTPQQQQYLQIQVSQLSQSDPLVALGFLVGQPVTPMAVDQRVNARDDDILRFLPEGPERRALVAQLERVRQAALQRLPQAFPAAAPPGRSQPPAAVYPQARAAPALDWWSRRRQFPTALGILVADATTGKPQHLDIKGGEQEVQEAARELIQAFEQAILGQKSQVRLCHVRIREGVTFVFPYQGPPNLISAKGACAMGVCVPYGVGEIWHVLRVMPAGASLEFRLDGMERIRPVIRWTQLAGAWLWCIFGAVLLLSQFLALGIIGFVLIALLLWLGYGVWNRGDSEAPQERDGCMLGAALLGAILYWPFFLFNGTHKRRKERIPHHRDAVMAALQAAEEAIALRTR